MSALRTFPLILPSPALLSTASTLQPTRSTHHHYTHSQSSALPLSNAKEVKPRPTTVPGRHKKTAAPPPIQSSTNVRLHRLHPRHHHLRRGYGGVVYDSQGGESDVSSWLASSGHPTPSRPMGGRSSLQGEIGRQGGRRMVGRKLWNQRNGAGQWNRMECTRGGALWARLAVLGRRAES